MKKKKLTTVVAGVTLLPTIGFAMGGMNHGSSHNMEHEDAKLEGATVTKFSKKLLLPTVLEGKVENGVRVFDIEAQKGKWEFLDGMPTETYGYNGPILGPILKIKKDEKTKVNIKNSLDKETTLHWHGMEVGESVDGVHNSEIMPGNSRSVEFTLTQPAATLWFHPHTMHKTAAQVYMGLAGLVYLEDASQTLNLPSTYGVDDIPVVVQEKMLDDKGQLQYSSTRMESMHGKVGGFMMVNGIIAPYTEVSEGIVRMRLLNGSNATVYNYSFDGQPFYQIASDGGFLNAPIEMKNVVLGPGERAEILIDTSKMAKTSYMTVNGNKAMEIRVKGKGKVNTMPTKLASIPEVTNDDIAKAKVKRDFVLTTTMRGNFINGKPFDMGRTDFTANAGEYEIWTVKNGAGMMNMPHPFHVHGTQFRIIERDGKLPPLNERGWKDSFTMNPGESVKILVKFDNPGMAVYHCHILEHEEAGMMGQFEMIETQN